MSRTVHSVSISARVPITAVATMLAFLHLVPVAGWSDEGRTLPSGVAFEHPGGEGPTRVSVALYLVDLMAIDDVRQTFSADLYLSMSWLDPRLAAADGESPWRGPLDDIWHPRLEFVNARRLVKAFDDVAEIDAEGRVLYLQRFSGELSSPVDLREFPFDTQVLPVRLISTRYSLDEVELVVDETRSGRLESFSVAGWTIDGYEVRAESLSLAAQDRELAGIGVDLRATRHSGFFILRVLLPLGLIVFMAWTVFWIDPKELGPQTGMATASVLTLIAFQLSLSALLPRVSYLTRIDRFLLGASVLVFLALAEAITTSRLAKGGRPELARRVDAWARLVYPAIFAGVVLMALWW